VPGYRFVAGKEPSGGDLDKPSGTDPWAAALAAACGVNPSCKAFTASGRLKITALPPEVEWVASPLLADGTKHECEGTYVKESGELVLMDELLIYEELAGLRGFMQGFF